jgi:hypothetical protein
LKSDSAASTPDELHNLNAIAVGNSCGLPLTSTYDVSVKFDGYTARRKFELVDELCKRQAVREVFAFAIQINAQTLIVLYFLG